MLILCLEGIYAQKFWTHTKTNSLSVSRREARVFWSICHRILITWNARELSTNHCQLAKDTWGAIEGHEQTPKQTIFLHKQFLTHEVRALGPEKKNAQPPFREAKEKQHELTPERTPQLADRISWARDRSHHSRALKFFPSQTHSHLFFLSREKHTKKKLSYDIVPVNTVNYPAALPFTLVSNSTQRIAILSILSSRYIRVCFTCLLRLLFENGLSDIGLFGGQSII